MAGTSASTRADERRPSRLRPRSSEHREGTMVKYLAALATIVALMGAAHMGAAHMGAAHMGAAQAADDYPTRPVRIIAGFGPGATIDVTARVLAPKLAQALGQQFVVENRTGAGSNLAADHVAQAGKDG